MTVKLEHVPSDKIAEFFLDDGRMITIYPLRAGHIADMEEPWIRQNMMVLLSRIITIDEHAPTMTEIANLKMQDYNLIWERTGLK